MHKITRTLMSLIIAIVFTGLSVGNTMQYSGSENNTVDKSYIGKWVNGVCVNTADWKCFHIELDLPIPW